MTLVGIPCALCARDDVDTYRLTDGNWYCSPCGFAAATGQLPADLEMPAPRLGLIPRLTDLVLKLFR